MSESKWGSRKLLLGLVLIAIGVAIELLSVRGLTETMAMFLGAIGATYFVGNVAEKVAENREGGVVEAAAPEMDLAPISARIESLEQAIVGASATISENDAQAKQSLLTLVNSVSYIIKRLDAGR